MLPGSSGFKDAIDGILEAQPEAFAEMLCLQWTWQAVFKRTGNASARNDAGHKQPRCLGRITIQCLRRREVWDCRGAFEDQSSVQPGRDIPGLASNNARVGPQRQSVVIKQALDRFKSACFGPVGLMPATLLATSPPANLEVHAIRAT